MIKTMHPLPLFACQEILIRTAQKPLLSEDAPSSPGHKQTPHNRINNIVNRILSMLQPTTKSQALSEADFSGIASSTSTARLSLSPIRRCPNFCSSKAFQIMTDCSSHTFYEGDWIVQRGKSVCLKNSLSSQTEIVCIRCMYSLVWT